MFPLKFLLKIAHLSRSTYYYQFSKKDKDEKNKDLMQLIAEIFNDNKGVLWISSYHPGIA